MDRWNGRVALVTGASVGIGAAICRDLIKHGLKVVGCARNVDQIRAIAEEPEMKASSGSLLPIKCDLTIESEILDMFKVIRQKYGRIDICINNAGMNIECSLMSAATEDMMTIFKINVLAQCICSRESIQLMQENKIDDGQIIQISSIAGHVVMGLETYGFYTGTKFMVNALAESLRKELTAAKSKIKVATISPGLVETEFFYRMSGGNSERSKEIFSSFKILEARDIAAAVVYVLSTPPHVDVNQIIIRPTEEVL